MEPLLEAIYAKASTTAAVTNAFPGWTDTSTGTTYPVGYYGDLAPERAPLPYLVSTVIAAPSTWGYGGESFAQPSIQFAAYGVGRAATYAKLKSFLDVFDGLVMTLSTGHQVNTFREGDPIPQLQDEKDDQNRDVWGWVVSYTFVITPA